MDQLTALYQQHLHQLLSDTRQALAQTGRRGVAVFAGAPKRYFLDDHDYAFQVNPPFKAYLPVIDNPWCLLLIGETGKPHLYYWRPSDYWHKVAEPAASYFWADQFEITEFASPEQLPGLISRDKEGWAFIGEETDFAAQLGFSACNPTDLLHLLDYARGCKSPYEQACLRQASQIAVAGHQTAREAFLAGQSEFGIHLAYQAATGQGDNELPYGSIVALNEHGAVLHYNRLQRQAPASSHSFLLDAGAEFHGYAADITRSYSREPDNAFGQLIAAMNTLQLSVIEAIEPGKTDFVALHELTHRKLAEVLVSQKLVNGSVDSVFEQGITRTFLPHGLGHLLGLQVHDVGGFLQDGAGTLRPAPSLYPALRLTRKLLPNMVLTIEPGLYFIDSLLAELKASKGGADVNWDKVDALRPYGGIRIEDNLILHTDRVENMTRDLGLA